MGTTLQGLQGAKLANNIVTKEGVNLFGIRHLSASGAFLVEKYLDIINPDIVLIEGPADGTGLISGITKRNVKPPLAMLFYTSNTPVHSIVYPYASYSPEYQGILWAKKKKKKCRFIDLPSNIKTSLYRTKEVEELEINKKIEELQGEGESLDEELLEKRLEYNAFNNNLYNEIAKLGGEENYDTYWERHFEHNMDLASYLATIKIHSYEIRNLTEDMEKEADPLAASINALREAYMKRSIIEAINEGIKPEKIVVILGAYHLDGIMNNEPLSDKELNDIPKSETQMTLMPYSYYKLSSFSGYGAGNSAPYYYEMMYNAMKEDDLKSLPSTYLSKLSELLREKHGYCSTATVIEGVKLAESLQFIHKGILPTLNDLHDSSIATMGEGEISSIEESFARLDVGTKIGKLPDGVSQTPIQDDMNRHLKKLKLEKYKSVVANDLKLDLRENIKVKSHELAFIDLNRSTFFHRLKLLGVDFAKYNRRAQNQQLASWAEHWVLCWTPEVEIQIVESVLYGETIESAASYVLKERIENAKDVVEVATLVRVALECKLFGLMHNAIKRLQEFSSESESFLDIVEAAREMSFIVQYGSLRKFDSSAVIPILEQLFLKASLILVKSSSCNNELARKVADSMTTMHNISQENYEIVNDGVWLSSLKKLYKADGKNPILCGFSLSILLERGEVSDEAINTEISLNLSSGNSPEFGASWLEGLTRRNRYVLLSKNTLWEQLDSYINELESEDFKKVLVCLRRVFSEFESHEKNGICDILSEIWGIDSLSIHEFLQDNLEDEENSLLDDLNDFDYKRLRTLVTKVMS